MVWAVLAIIAGLILFDLCTRISSVKGGLWIFEHAPTFRVAESSPDPDAERISFSTSHGLTLRGSLYRHQDQPSMGLIIFCHEFGGNHWSAMSYAEGLWNAGFDLLAFDFRNQGESDQMPNYEPLHWLTEYEVQDALSAIRYAQEREDLNHLPVGLFGVSKGGGAALVAAARTPSVECVACDSVYSVDSMMMHFASRWATLFVPAWWMKMVPQWQLRLALLTVRWLSQMKRGCRYIPLERWLPRLRNRPIFLVSGERDTYVLPEITQVLCQRAKRDDCVTWIVPGAKHNMARQVDPVEYDSRLLELFSCLMPEEEVATSVVSPST